MLSKPTSEQIASILHSFGISATDRDVESYRALVEGSIAANAAIDELEDAAGEVVAGDRDWYRPEPDDNEYNAWYVKVDIRGADDGPLQGRTVAIKDNMFVAKVPMMNGTKILDGYVPPVDATVVTRLLEAGATISGKAVCEAYCFSGGSHTSDSGPVLNPHSPAHSAGGSSSGSAALVAGGKVDMAIGCDQGGSIRVPAAYCGIYGLKPTHGLVPYTGILGVAPSIDHVGPMTSNIADNALLLQVIAGVDGLDSRQYSPRLDAYLSALDRDIAGLRIGVLTQGFGHDVSEPDVDEKVRNAAARFADLGMEVSEVSIPLHSLGAAIGFAVIQSGIETIFHHDGCLLGRLDPAVVSMVDRQRTWRERADELPETVKLMLVLCEFLRREHGYEYVAKGTNQIRHLRAAYDTALMDVDLLLMPTTPMKATLLPAPELDRANNFDLAFAPAANTMPFDLTHHPAMSIPCGMSGGLPIGLMLVGRHFEESAIYRAAYAFEQHLEWRDL